VRSNQNQKILINQLKQWGGKSTIEIQGIEEKVVFSLPKGLKK
jgi:4-hydroxy-3-methylbut-2-enyl diphosphate reductase